MSAVVGPTRRPSQAVGQKPPLRSVSVVVCAYTIERWQQLLRAVASAQAQTLAPSQVVVVVDHAPELLERAKSGIEGAVVVANQRASGLSGARDTGAEAATGSLLAFLDDDAEADRHWLERLTKAAQAPDVLGSGGTIEPRWLAGEPRWFPPEFRWVVGCTYEGMPEDEGEIRNPIGANMMVRADVLREIGGFREGVGSSRNDPDDPGTAGTDETELAIRAAQRWPERRWVFAADAVVTHDVPAARSSWRYFIARCRDEGRAKARLARLRGSADALSSERRYVRRVLPAAVVRNLAGAVRRREIAPLLRAVAIIAGLAVTAQAYGLERVGAALHRH